MTALERIRVAALGFALAEADRGVREEGGNNEGERIREYLRGAGITVAAAWCAAFVDYCFEAVARDMKLPNPLEPVKLEAYVEDYAVQLSDLAVDASLVEPGDLVCFSFGGSRWDHIGIVLEAPNSDGHFRTVEGNTSDENQREGDAVALKRRTISTGTRTPLFLSIARAA